MQLITAVNENVYINKLHEHLEDSFGIFRFDEEFGNLEVLVVSNETFEWVNVTEAYRKGFKPQAELAEVKSIGGKRSE